MSALKGIRVLELAETVSGEYCGKLLADFGAEVIKIEPPGGSPTRRLGPFGGADAAPPEERSGLFAYLNTNKRSVTLDLTDEAGAATLAALVEQVGGVIDDHAPGWLASMGLDPATVETQYPGVVLCSITPFGQEAPEQRRWAEDITVFHASGWGYHTPTGADPARAPLNGAGRFLPSYESGLDAALCVVAALYEREESGLGRFIDVSGQAVMASRVDYVLGQMIAGDMGVSAERDAFDLAGPAGIFPCRDGHIYIWMSAPGHWEGLRELLGHPGWMDDFPEHWLERACTPERVALVRQHLEQWLADKNKREVAEQAQKLGLTLVEVNRPADLQDSPQYQFRGFFARVEHPVLGDALYPTVPYQLSETPASLDSPAPALGQHTQAYLDGATTPGGES